MADISSSLDIQTLVDAFYAKATKDEILAPIFKHHVGTSMDKHMPTMYQFWESVLFDKTTYKGNPMLKHISLHSETPLTPTHFERWLHLWSRTVDELFAGKVANDAKKRAVMMGQLMQYKLDASSEDGFIQ